DPAEGRRDALDRVDERVDRRGVDLDVEYVDAGELLEEDALALHHGLAGEGADVTEAQDGGAVSDDGDEVALVRVAVRVVGRRLDAQARRRDAGRVGEREVALRRDGLRRDDLGLARPRVLVVLERGGVEAGRGRPRRFGVR